MKTANNTDIVSNGVNDDEIDNTLSQEEILMNENDILNGILKAGNAKEDEENFRK